MGGDEVLPFLAGLGKSEQRERSEQKKFDTVFFRSYSSFSLYDTIRPYSNLLARILNPYCFAPAAANTVRVFVAFQLRGWVDFLFKLTDLAKPVEMPCLCCSAPSTVNIAAVRQLIQLHAPCTNPVASTASTAHSPLCSNPPSTHPNRSNTLAVIASRRGSCASPCLHHHRAPSQFAFGPVRVPSARAPAQYRKTCSPSRATRAHCHRIAAALSTAAAVPHHVGRAACQLMSRMPGSLARNCASAP